MVARVSDALIVGVIVGTISLSIFSLSVSVRLPSRDLTEFATQALIVMGVKLLMTPNNAFDPKLDWTVLLTAGTMAGAT